MTMPLQCRCGTVQGEIEPERAYARATCYCKDCRAFARYLAVPGVLDASGGTDVIPFAPAAVRFTAGTEHVACMSLSPKGLLRWYATCCRTPLANTPRDPRLPYAGVVTACVAATPQALEAAFGPRDHIVVNAASATAPVRPTPLAFMWGGVRIFAGILGARLRRERTWAFFDANGRPLREPHVISREERAALQ